MTQEELTEIIENHALWLKNKNTGKRANLSNLDLSELYLRNVDLRKADLSGCNLTGANLSDSDLSGVNLCTANLHEANLNYTNISNANLYQANLTNVSGIRVNLSNSNLIRANLSKSDLSGANLSRAKLIGAWLYKSNLINVSLENAEADRLGQFYPNISAAKNIIKFNKPLGRTCYAVIHENYSTVYVGTLWIHEKYMMIHAGCFWGTLDEFEIKAKEKYGDDTKENYAEQIKNLRLILKEKNDPH